MAQAPRRTFVQLVPSLLFAFALLIGVALGQYFALRPVRRDLERFTDRLELGPRLDRGERPRIAAVYHDPQAALRDMDGYTWRVINAPVPFVGHAPAPGQQGNAHINAQQFRRAEDLAVPKPDGVFRVFVTGGSTAFGSGAPDDDRTVAGYLERALSAEWTPRTGRRYEIVNAANPAWASTQERLWIQHHVRHFAPDLVISLSGNNDIHWARLGRDVTWMRSYADQHFFDLVRGIYARSGVATLPDVVPVSDEPLPVDGIAPRLAENLALTARTLDCDGVPYVFALQPTLAASGKPLSDREREILEAERLAPGTAVYFADAYARIRASLAGANLVGFRFVDLSGVFDAASPEDEIFLDSYHFGDRGNERIARALSEAIADELAAPRASPAADPWCVARSPSLSRPRLQDSEGPRGKATQVDDGRTMLRCTSKKASENR